MKLSQMLNKNKMTLIVSLPQNRTELAEAAVRGGADALKVHANVFHQASGNRFGSVYEQREVFKELLDSFEVPIGLVPGAQVCASQDELKLAEQLGFSFLSVFVFHMPLYMLETKMDKMLAINESYDTAHLKVLNKLDVDIIEADVFSDDKREKIHVSDLLRFGRIVESVDKPVVVPTQRIIEPDEVKFLYKLGIKGIMIGAIVTGSSPDSIERITRQFRQAIDSL
ncbi:putative N-acetylmannosamine-6-phosphate epimerase [Caldicoprobacter guelmensis]|uniref:hypothetical protein n=1 Tax=Caldicoprobacter guelmensis TaxID=1170224 RepID=UPI00195A0272|nr:hypothetical protein [Caldicoprobacter guelmensis]MBM7583142.1 putative N-acetylmannosamine-6-phosphate epimerase [Caldicoprobacter guelmensis]